MPSNAQGLSFQFIRRAVSGSALGPGAGILKLSGIPRDLLLYRQLFCAVVASGLSDWSAVGELRVMDQDREAFLLREQFGNAANSYGASSTTWGAGVNSDRDGFTGFPAFRVDEIDPTTQPNRNPGPFTMGSLSFQSVYTPGATKQGAIVTMVPFPLVGRITELQFRFASATVTTSESTPLVEVYLGVMSSATR